MYEKTDLQYHDSSVDTIKYEDNKPEPESLTTVVGIKCDEGIIFASDSLYTGDISRMFGSKIYGINKSVILGATGRIDQISMLENALKQKLKDNTYDDDAWRFDVEEVLLELHEKYNIRWTKKLKKETTVFKPQSILGAKLKDDGMLNRFLYVSIIEDDLMSVMLN